MQTNQPQIGQQRREAVQQARPEIEKQRKDAEQQAERTLDKEAIAAVDETKNALKAIEQDKPDEAIVACPELDPYPVQVPHGVPGKEDSSVWVAIRPEKMNLHKYADAPPAVPECPAAHNVAKGEIKDISYLGDISIYHVLLANGRLIRISRPNRSRWAPLAVPARQSSSARVGRRRRRRCRIAATDSELRSLIRTVREWRSTGRR